MPNIFIGIKRIVLVDSADFAYAELDIDDHSILLATGNVGKSSIINATRLFLLPECSLRNQDVNFGFLDPMGKFYPSEATFKHYFPSRFSFLILEYEKTLLGAPHCCQILTSAGSHLKFKRIFTHLSFDQLRHQFWDAAGDQDGIGQRVETLSKDRVYQFIKQNDRHCQIVRDSKKCADILYESDLNQADFTLLPLRDTEPHTIGALRAVIKLLLMGKSDDKSFTNAIANIIESKKKDRDSELVFNIAMFKERHEDLQTQEAITTIITNKRKDYDKCVQLKSSWLNQLEKLKSFLGCLQFLETQKEHITNQQQDKAQQFQVANDVYRQKKEHVKKTEKDVDEKNSLIKQARRDLNTCQTKLDRVAQIKIEFHDQKSTTELLEWLQQDKEQIETQLSVLTGQSELDQEIQKLQSNRQKLVTTLDSLRKSRDNQEYMLLNQLSSNCAKTLMAINPKLHIANPLRDITGEEKQAIEGFVALFDEHEVNYLFFDQYLKKTTLSPSDLDAEITKNEQLIEDIESQIRKLCKEHSNPLYQQKEIEDKQKALSILEKDVELLSNEDYNQKRLKELKEQIEHNETLKQSLDAQLNQAISEFHEAEKQWASLSNERKDIEDKLRDNRNVYHQFNRESIAFKSWLSLIDESAVPDVNSATEDDLDLFKANARNLRDYLGKLKDKLRAFVDEKIIDDTFSITGDPNWEQLSKTVDALTEVYGNIDTRIALLKTQIIEHNKTIANKKKILTYNYKVIKAFEQEINEAFTTITINNIEKVEYKVGINSLFESLVKDLESEDLFSGDMVSDDFYQKLMAFANRFFTKSDSFTLTMEKVVESLQLKMKLNHKVSSSDVAQSTSTTALINTKLVQLLLKRLIALNCATALPIVFDEAAKVDIGQFDWWLSDLKAHGFNLLSAGTHSTGSEVVEVIGNHHIMDAMQTELPYHSERFQVYWAGAEKFSQKPSNTTIDVNAQETMI